MGDIINLHQLDIVAELTNQGKPKGKSRSFICVPNYNKTTFKQFKPTVDGTKILLRESLIPHSSVASSGINEGGPIAMDTIVPIEEDNV